ncbi:MAG: ATP-binding protein [Eubacteriales bacterium]|nr:ATP-binding protein [Eubacteriales bacterium]
MLDKDQIEIDVAELAELPVGSFLAIDIRDAESVANGMLPGAQAIFASELMERVSTLPHDKTIILYCTKGTVSAELVPLLRNQGFEAFSLAGGYAAWALAGASGESRASEIEASIRGPFKKKLFTPFAKAITTYGLIRENDKIAVCISGGKDSMLMAKLFQELKRHNKFPFELVFLMMDPGYSAENRKLIEQNAKLMGIPLTIFESNIFDAVYEIEKSPCYLCARMRRGYLYSRAKELGCNKIALGHHYDDVIETILMGMLYGAQVQTMMPKLHSSNFEGMELIRPMYLVRETDIKRFRDENRLHFLQCACRFTDSCSVFADADDSGTSHKRAEVKRLIAELKKKNPYVEGNIFRSVENVNLSTIIAYKKDGVKHYFTEEYDRKGSQEE